MKTTVRLVSILALVVFSCLEWQPFAGARGPVYVHGYTRHTGTHVAAHYRSAPDHSVFNNWSTIGNINPFTGRPGTHSPYPGYHVYPQYSFPISPSVPGSRQWAQPGD